MIRSVAEYSSGVIPPKLASLESTTAMMDILVGKMTSFLSNGEPAWTVIDEISSVDKVLHSVGDRSIGSGDLKGDTDLYVRLTANTMYIQFRTYQSWSDVSHTGNGVTTTKYFGVPAFANVQWELMVNEYEDVLFAYTDAYLNCALFSHPVTPDFQADARARLTAATSGTGTVVLNVNRDLTTKLFPGQKTWIVNRTAPPNMAGPGGALAPAYVNIVDVVAVTASTITVSGVTSTPFEIGSMVGWHPCAFAMFVNDDTGYSSIRSDGTVVSHTSILDGINGGTGATTAADCKPGMTDVVYMLPAQVSCYVGGYDWPLGRLQHMMAVAVCVQEGQWLLLDCDPESRWQVKIGNERMFTYYGCAIGPIPETP